jgi:hypothetical protein
LSEGCIFISFVGNSVQSHLKYKECFFLPIHRNNLTNINGLILELYEPGLSVKKFGGPCDVQLFLGCFWNNLQIHIKAETMAPFEKEEIEKRKEVYPPSAAPKAAKDKGNLG